MKSHEFKNHSPEQELNEADLAEGYYEIMDKVTECEHNNDYTQADEWEHKAWELNALSKQVYGKDIPEMPRTRNIQERRAVLATEAIAQYFYK